MTLVNLCFHGIGRPGRELEPGEAAYWIGVPELHGVLDLVAGRDDVRLSFDDGNVSDVRIGLPALQERGLRATFFVLAGRLDLPGSLSRDDVLELRDAGMGIGTHGMWHRPWRGLQEPERTEELVTAREVLADLVGGPVAEAALPLGRYDRRLLSQLRGLGYARVHTSDRRRARAGAWLQARYSLRHDDTPDSVRDEVLAPPGFRTRARSSAVALVKRLR